MGNASPPGLPGFERSTLKRRTSGPCAVALAAAVGLSLFSSCKKEPGGVIDPPLASPYIVSARVGQDRLNLDSASTAVTRLPDGSYRISDSLFVQAILSPEGTARGTFRLYPPGANGAAASGRMEPDASSSGNSAGYFARFSFETFRGGIGPYLLETFLTTPSGRESNHRFASLRITRTNFRPLLSGLAAPDTLYKPATGTEIVRFAVTASDSDGSDDIDRVFFKSDSSQSPNFEQPMFDDGNLGGSGDSLAGDGRYARILNLDSTATTGTKGFRFWALDKSGALSDPLVHIIVILDRR